MHLCSHGLVSMFVSHIHAPGNNFSQFVCGEDFLIFFQIEKYSNHVLLVFQLVNNPPTCIGRCQIHGICQMGTSKQRERVISTSNSFNTAAENESPQGRLLQKEQQNPTWPTLVGSTDLPPEILISSVLSYKGPICQLRQL